MKICIAVLFCAIISFVFADCSTGRTDYYEGSITAHLYKPPHTEISTDSDGNIDSTDYPEEFHLMGRILPDTGRTFDITVSQNKYILKHDEEIIVVRYRKGRWTKARYLETIE